MAYDFTKAWQYLDEAYAREDYKQESAIPTKAAPPPPTDLKANVNPEFAQKHPFINKALDVVTTPLQAVFNNPWVKRTGQTGSEIAFLTDRPDKVSTGSRAGDVSADLLGSVLGFASPTSAGQQLFSGGMRATEKVLPKASSMIPRGIAQSTPQAAKSALKYAAPVAGGSVTFEGGMGLTNNRPLSAGEMGMAAGANVALDLATRGLLNLPKMRQNAGQGTQTLNNLDLRTPTINNVPRTSRSGFMDAGAGSPGRPDPWRFLPNERGAAGQMLNNIQKPDIAASKPRSGFMEVDMPSVRTQAERMTHKPYESMEVKLSQEPRVQVQAAKMKHDPYFSAEIELPSARQPLNTSGPGNANSFRFKVSRGRPSRKGSLKEFWNRMQTQFIDDVSELGRLEKRVTGSIASAENSIYKQARLFKGSPAKANEIVRGRLAPIVNRIEKQGHTADDLGDYALAVHARDVNAQGKQSGFNDMEIQDVINRYGTPEMEQARKELVKVGNDTLQELANAEVISQKLVNTLKSKYPNYIPLFRNMDDGKVEFTTGLSKRLANVSSPIKKLKGSQRQVVDPLENMVKNIFQATNAADRNRVALQLRKLSQVDKENNYIRKLKPNEAVGRKNVVHALENGEKVQYEVEPEVYKALLNLDKESSNFLIKILQKPASVLRAGATLTPEFSFRNPMRDIVQAFIVSDSRFNPVTDFPVALWQTIFKKPLYQQFLKDNGGYGNIISMDRRVHQEALKKVLKEPVTSKFVNVVNGKGLINLLRSIADVSETATKLGEYRAALRQGTSRPEAAYRARDIMDFARAGSSIREANKIVAFLNANIQGKSKILRAVKQNPLGVTMRGIGAVSMPTIGAFIAQQRLANDKQKNTIEEAPEWLKNNFWLIPVPGTELVARVPKPFDLAPIFANLPEKMLEYGVKKDPEAFDSFVKEQFSMLSVPTMITGMLPFIEGMSNYSFFRQGPIIPQREQNIKLTDQYDVNTSEVAKGIAKGMYSLTGGEGALKNFSSPRIVDNTIRGTTAGLGEYATDAIDAILRGMDMVQGPERPATGLSQKPLFKSFLVNEQQTSKALDALYNERDKLEREYGSARDNKQPFKEMSRLKYLRSTTSKLGNVSTRIREIRNSPKMSAEQKRREVQKWVDKRNEIAENAARKLKDRR